MPDFAKKIAGVKKTNNHKKSVLTKVSIRRRILGEIHDARVFDAFAGSGKMYREVWHRAQSYVACDMKWYPDAREAFVCNNVRALRALDLNKFNLFDFDAYGSPYTQLRIVAMQRKVAAGERIGIVLTDGSAMKAKMNALPSDMAWMAGVQTNLNGACRLLEQIRTRAIQRAASMMGCEIEVWLDGKWKSAAQVHYLGLVLRGVDQ